MRLRAIFLIGFLLAAPFVVKADSGGSSGSQKKMSDYQCAAGTDTPYKGDNDPYDSYPFSPANDIHPARGQCFDNNETFFNNDAGKLSHPAACYSTTIDTNARANPTLSGSKQTIVTRDPNLDAYICGRNTRFASLDDYCGYVGQTPPSPSDDYATRKKKLMECFKTYIPEYAQLADRGEYVMSRYMPSEIVDDPSNPGQSLNTSNNLCYLSYLAEGKNPDGTFKHIPSEMQDAFGSGQTDVRYMGTGNEQAMSRIRDACHPYSPRHNYFAKDTPLGNALADFFKYQDGRCGNWYGESHDGGPNNLNVHGMNILVERLSRFDTYFMQAFNYPAFKDFCIKGCKPKDPAYCQQYDDWLKKFYEARNAACPILERHYSDTLPPMITDPDFGVQKGTIDDEAQFAGRWVFEEPNINDVQPISGDPGIVTRDSDNNPQPKKGKELLFGSAFKGGVDPDSLGSQQEGKDTQLAPFPMPTYPVYGGAPVRGAQAAVINSAVANTNNNIYGSADQLFKASPDAGGKLTVIQGPPGCDQGGAFELMLYQARCMNWFGTTCLCDYDKTFRKGSDLNYVLQRAGAKIPIVQEQKDQNGNIAKDKNGNTVYETIQFPWPMVWRNYANNYYAKRYLKDQPSFKRGLQNALPGNFILWRDINGAPKHVAYVERVSWQSELNQCVPPGGGGGPQPGTRNYDHVDITEMNNGKMRDICGDTDQWGLVTTRALYNASASIPPLPDGSSSDCTNSDAATCREANWSRVEVYDPRDTANLWGKWDDGPDKEDFSAPPKTCNLPKDFNCPNYDTPTSNQYCKKDSNGKFTFSYTADQKKQIIRRRQQWVWGKVKLASGQSGEDKVEDCDAGTVDACCPPGSGYRCLIGCDPPVDLRRHSAMEPYPSIELNTIQGRAPLTGSDAVMDMSTRSCPMFPSIYYLNEKFPCNVDCGADTVDTAEDGARFACPQRPGGCPQGLKPGTEEGCLAGGGGGGSGSGSGSGGASTSSTSGGTSNGSTNGGSNGGASSGSDTSSGSDSSSGSDTSSSGGSSGNSSSGGGGGSSSSSSGGDLPQCTATQAAPDGSCTGLSCPPKRSCNWATDKVYSEMYVESVLGYSPSNPVPYLPYVTLSSPSSGGSTQRIASPVHWLDNPNSPLWDKVILGTSKNISKSDPQIGDIAVIIDSRYCVGQAGLITSVPQQGCFIMQSTNWQKYCDIWDDTTCHQACNASQSASLFTTDSVFQSKPCLTQSDLGQTGFIFRP